MTPILGEIIGWEFFLVLGIALLLFGGTQIPKIARSLGQASKELKKGLADDPDDSEPQKP